MIEIDVENELNLKVFINGIPNIDNIPPEKRESIIHVLELEIWNFYNGKEKPWEKRNNKYC